MKFLWKKRLLILEKKLGDCLFSSTNAFLAEVFFFYLEKLCPLAKEKFYIF